MSRTEARRATAVTRVTFRQALRSLRCSTFEEMRPFTETEPWSVAAHRLNLELDYLECVHLDRDDRS